MRKRLGFIVFIMPFVVFSQGRRIVSLDAGASVFTPFEKNTIAMYGPYTNHLTFKPAAGYFFKIGAERIICTKNNLSFSIPFGFTYRDQKFSYTESGHIVLPPEPLQDVIWASSGTKDVQSEQKSAAVCFGPKLSYSKSKFTFFTALNLNMAYVFSWSERFSAHTDQGPEMTYNTGGTLYGCARTNINLSFQNGIVYNLNDQLGIGLSADVFFLNMLVFNPDWRNFQHLNNMSFGMDPYGFSSNPHVVSSIVNAGLRIQYRF